MASQPQEHMATRPSGSSGQVAQVAQDCYAGLAPQSEVRPTVETMAQRTAFLLGRWVGRILVATTILAAIMWADTAESCEPMRIDIDAAVRYIAENSPAATAEMRDCVDAGHLRVNCARRVLYGYDLRRDHGNETAKR